MSVRDLMKQLAILLLMGFLTFTVACDESPVDEPDPEEEVEEEEEEEEEEKKEEEEEEEEEEETKVDISILASKFYHTSAVSVTVTDDHVIISSSDQPDQRAVWPLPNNLTMYEDYDEPNNPDFKRNPNSIEIQNFVYTLPRFPEEATNKEATDFGPMGVAVNSVAFYNQNAGPGDDILEELNTFDQYEGHPAQSGDYHYHLEPIWLTETISDDAFWGCCWMDFPCVPVEGGKRLTNADLDDYHGHISATAEFLMASIITTSQMSFHGSMVMAIGTPGKCHQSKNSTLKMRVLFLFLLCSLFLALFWYEGGEEHDGAVVGAAEKQIPNTQLVSTHEGLRKDSSGVLLYREVPIPVICWTWTREGQVILATGVL